MADNNVEVKISADTTDAQSGLEEIIASIKLLSDMIDGAIARFQKFQDEAGKAQRAGQSGGRDGSGAAGRASAGLRSADTDYRRTQEMLSAELKLHLITYDQESAALLAALEVRYAARKAARDQEAKESAGNAARLAKISQQQAADDAKQKLETSRIVNRQVEQDAKSWESVLQPIEGAWDSQLRKLLAGTETFGQAMKHVFADLVMDAIKQFEKLAVEKAATGLAGSGIGSPQTLLSNMLGGGGGQAAAAATMGKFTTSVEGLNASLLGQGTVTAANTAATTADTAATTAETTATTSQTAAQAASGAGGLFSGFSSGFKSLLTLFGLPLPFAAGTDYVLNSGLAFIHQGETIVPARGTGPFTGAGLGGALGGGDTHNWNVTAVDATSFQRWLGAGGAQQIARAVSAVQARTPSMNW
jgi:hypothetical protein